MKKMFKKIGLLVVFGLNFQFAYAGLVMYGVRGAGQFAWVVGKSLMQYVRPIVKETVQKVQPAVREFIESPETKEMAQAAIQWTKANPKHAAAMGIGAYAGYKTSGDEVIKTTIGATLGAAAGFSLYLNYLRLAAVKEWAFATESVAVLEKEVAILKERAMLGQQVLHEALSKKDILANVAQNGQVALKELTKTVSTAGETLGKAISFSAKTEGHALSSLKALWELRSAKTALIVRDSAKRGTASLESITFGMV